FHVQPFAHEPPLHVGEGDHDRVDLPGVGLLGQFLQRQHGSTRRARSTKRSSSRRAHGDSSISSSGWHWTATILSPPSSASTTPSALRAVTRRPAPRSLIAWWCKLF